jgi:hypothetical protein
MFGILDKVADSCINMKFEDAKKRIEKAGAVYRITEKDGNALIVSADYNPKRINLDINNGIVIRTRVG